MFWEAPFDVKAAEEACQQQYGVTPRPLWASIQYVLPNCSRLLAVITPFAVALTCCAACKEHITAMHPCAGAQHLKGLSLLQLDRVLSAQVGGPGPAHAEQPGVQQRPAGPLVQRRRAPEPVGFGGCSRHSRRGAPPGCTPSLTCIVQPA